MNDVQVNEQARIEQAFGITVPLETMDFESLLSLAMQARELYDEARWILGDIARVVVQKFGFKELDEFATKVGVAKDSLLRYREVAERVHSPLREKYKLLSWSHFRTAVAQPEPEKWLEKAADGEWGVERLQVEIKKDKLGIQALIVRPRLVRCEDCGRYYIDDTDKRDLWCEKKGKHYE